MRNDDKLWVAFLDSAHDNKTSVMQYNSNSNSRDYLGTPGFSEGGARDISLSIDRLGNPIVAFTDYDHDNKLNVMHYNSDNNSRDYLGTPGFSESEAYYSSITWDINGYPVVAYRDANGDKLSVMHYNPDNNSRDYLGTPGFSDDQVNFVSLAAASDGNLFVGYQDFAHGNKFSVMSLTADPEGKSTYQWYRDDVAIE